MPVAAAILGLSPPIARAVSATQQRTSVAAVIDDSTGLPHKWVYSTGSWTQREYSKIYEFYCRNGKHAGPPPSSKAAKQSKLALQGPAASAPKKSKLGPKNTQTEVHSTRVTAVTPARPSVAPVQAIKPHIVKAVVVVDTPTIITTTTTAPKAAGPTLPSIQKFMETSAAGAAVTYSTFSTQAAEQTSRFLAHVEDPSCRLPASGGGNKRHR